MRPTGVFAEKRDPENVTADQQWQQGTSRFERGKGVREDRNGQHCCSGDTRFGQTTEERA
jgi:hypothetical protein